MPNLPALFSRFSISSLGNNFSSSASVFCFFDFLGLLSLPFPLFLPPPCLSLLLLLLVLLPVAPRGGISLSCFFVPNLSARSSLVTTTGILKRFARSFFLSKDVTSLALLDEVFEASFSFLPSSDSTGVPSSLGSSFDGSSDFASSVAVALSFGRSSPVLGTSFPGGSATCSSSVVLAGAAFSGLSSCFVTFSAVVSVDCGATTIPNSSSSKRACNRLTKSALRPSVERPRFWSAARSSDTFIFLTFISSPIVAQCRR
mmetsp:Transcript_19897/g.33967  ORF Transcript_19897/g.33967 Transcript_19897/m.33967 type:complete len:258 (-) Transcript_19897:70-843(-)